MYQGKLGERKKRNRKVRCKRNKKGRAKRGEKKLYTGMESQCLQIDNSIGLQQIYSNKLSQKTRPHVKQSY